MQFLWIALPSYSSFEWNLFFFSFILLYSSSIYGQGWYFYYFLPMKTINKWYYFIILIKNFDTFIWLLESYFHKCIFSLVLFKCSYDSNILRMLFFFRYGVFMKTGMTSVLTMLLLITIASHMFHFFQFSFHVNFMLYNDGIWIILLRKRCFTDFEKFLWILVQFGSIPFLKKYLILEYCFICNKI